MSHPTLTILKHSEEQDTETVQQVSIEHVERDSDKHITVYGRRVEGTIWYFVLDQGVVDRISATNEYTISSKLLSMFSFRTLARIRNELYAEHEKQGRPIDSPLSNLIDIVTEVIQQS